MGEGPSAGVFTSWWKMEIRWTRAMLQKGKAEGEGPPTERLTAEEGAPGFSGGAPLKHPSAAREGRHGVPEMKRQPGRGTRESPGRAGWRRPRTQPARVGTRGWDTPCGKVLGNRKHNTRD